MFVCFLKNKSVLNWINACDGFTVNVWPCDKLCCFLPIMYIFLISSITPRQSLLTRITSGVKNKQTNKRTICASDQRRPCYRSLPSARYIQWMYFGLDSSQNNLNGSTHTLVIVCHTGCNLLNSAPAARPADSLCVCVCVCVCPMFGIVVMGGRSHLGSAPLQTEQQQQQQAERTGDVNGS